MILPSLVRITHDEADTFLCTAVQRAILARLVCEGLAEAVANAAWFRLRP